MDEGIGARFFRETRHRRGKLVGGRMDRRNQPDWLTTYADAPRIVLPPPAHDGPGIFDIMGKRRSRRRYSEAPLTLAELAQLLWAAAGITGVHGEIALRAAPSAGALYPIETYIVLHNVEGVAPGLYHYAVREHALEQLRVGDLREEIARAALDQPMAAKAAAVFVWAAVFERCRWKYGQRAYRYVWLDVAHIAENVALAAVALGLGSCQVAAIYDDEADELLGLDGEDESCLYMTTVGHLA